LILPFKLWLLGVLSFHQLPVHSGPLPALLIENIEDAFVQASAIRPVVCALRELADRAPIVPVSNSDNQLQLPLIHKVSFVPTDPDAREHAAILAWSAMGDWDFIGLENVRPYFLVIGRNIAVRPSYNGSGGHSSIVPQPEGYGNKAINLFSRYLVDKQVWANVSGVGFRDKLQTALGIISAAPSLVGGMPRIDGRTDSGEHGYEAERQPQSANDCLLVGEDGRCFGGVRRTSLLYKVISLQAVFFFGFLTAYSAFRAFPPGKGVNRRWLAIVAASAVISGLALISSVTGKIWLFGI